jgi:hypothetical protein
MDKIINGKVAAIIDDTTLVLNVGYRQGVREGMVFVIFAEHGEIADPETGEGLGKWEMVKARVAVTHVQERLCTVRAPVVQEERVTDGTRPLSALMVEHSLGHYGGRGEGWQRLQVRAADLGGRPQSQPISVGDGARSVVADSSQEETADREEGDDAAQAE